MKSAKPAGVDSASHRRSQPVRQTRTNPARSSANASRSGAARDSLASGPAGDQPIDVFPAISHFADTITALPKELVRHFTLLKEVDAKIFTPEEQLFKLVSAAVNAPYPEQRSRNNTWNASMPTSAPMSAQGSSNGVPSSVNAYPVAPTSDHPTTTSSGVFDPANIPRRQLFRQTAFKIQEMLVALEEKNHVISTANEALQRQLARVEDVWPHLENEFSDEAKWGSTTHWAYPENRNPKVTNNERVRRDGVAAISAAAQALADEAAARSDARKQALLAKKNLKNNHHDSDADDHDGRQKKETGKRSQPNKGRKTAENNTVGLGISTSATNGNPPQKRRKVEKVTNGIAPTERAISSVLGNNAPKAKTSSPRETPVPDGPKKRKALPSGSGQSKKKNGAAGMSPSTTSSPVLPLLADPKIPSRKSPAPINAPPQSSRARQNSVQSNADNGKTRPQSATTNKANGNAPSTPDLGAQNNSPRPGNDPNPTKDTAILTKEEPVKKDSETADSASSMPTPSVSKKEIKPEETDRKSEPVPPLTQSTPTVTTKSGRASKPSTPALATFQEAARPRSSRNTEGGGQKRSHKKSASTSQAIIPPSVSDRRSSVAHVAAADDDDGDIDADEPTYCYCNSVSYGEMVACDADGCPREWFHLACVGLKVAPGSKTKWYCEDCKERLKMGVKKVAGR